MATPLDYTDQKLHDLGAVWFAGVTADTDEGKAVRAKLDKRGYHRVIAGAPKGEATQADLGAALYREFDQARTVRGGAAVAVATDSGGHDEKGAPLRAWMREQHGVAIAVKRDEEPAALEKLPTLGELSTDAGLSKSSDRLVKFFDLDDVQAVLAPYGIDKAEVKLGAKLRHDWLGAGTQVVVGRGARQTATGAHVDARARFASWLNKWWGILKAALPGQDGLLKTVGIETAALHAAPRKAGDKGKTGEPPTGDTAPGDAAKDQPVAAVK